MKCPFCQNELESGFLHSERSLFFSTENREHGGHYYPEKEDIKLSNSWGAALPVLSCPKCHIVYLSTQFREKKKGE